VKHQNKKTENFRMTACAMSLKLVLLLWFSGVTAGLEDQIKAAIHYSVLSDFRTDGWSSEIHPSLSESTGIVKLRSPILNITVTSDFSNPRDIDLLQALFFAPLPAEIRVVPFYNKSSKASVILGKCFDTIAFDSRGTLDVVRVRDFINSLFLLADLSAGAPLDVPAGKYISERASILICNLYTQQFTVISDWIHRVQRDEINSTATNFSLPRTLIINGRSFGPNASLSTVLQSLVEVQYETIRSLTSNVYDEL